MSGFDGFCCAIRSLERTRLSNRTKIIESLNRSFPGKTFLPEYLPENKNFLIGNPPSQVKTGGPVDTNPPTQPRSTGTRPAFAKAVSSTSGQILRHLGYSQHPRTPTRGFDPKLQIQLIRIW